MKNCLVVDDSKVIRKVARHILESLDLSVSEAVDGQDALTQCEAAAPDVVLLDWNMPIMSGMEFLQALSSAKMTARPKIIFCTTESGILRDQYFARRIVNPVGQGIFTKSAEHDRVNRPDARACQTSDSQLRHHLQV